MPAKKIEDDSKVMDVSKPGKGKIMTTSRPVVAPIVSDAPKEQSASATTPSEEEVKPLAPSASHRVIQPLSNIEVTSDESTEESVNVVSTAPESPESTEETPVPAEPAKEAQPAQAESAVKESIPPSSEKATPKASEPKTVPETKPAEEKPVEDIKSADSPSTSDAAGVDAMAGAAEAKKLSAKEAEEQTKRDTAVQELINSKKYVVPIGHESIAAKGGHRHHEWLMVFIILVIAGAVAGYLLADAGVIDPGFDLPYEVIKN